MLSEKECWYWLCTCPGIGPKKIDYLLEHYKNVQHIYNERKGIAEKSSKGTSRWAQALMSDVYGDEKRIRDSMKKVYDFGGRFIYRDEEDFPKGLKHIYDVPAGLFCYGTLSEPTQPIIAIVGARRASGYGLEAAHYFARELSRQGIGIVSGLARGVDAQAHRGALFGIGKTWAVLGNGINICYPKENFNLYMQIKEQGGLISEYDMDVQPEAWHFPLRNRIISGMADGIFVIEAEEKSGSLITAEYALEQGKNVYALPGEFYQRSSRGCHNLIQHGAKLVYKVEDILEDFQMSVNYRSFFNEKIKLSLANSEQLVYASLRLNPKDIDTIVSESGVPLKETIQILMKLEMEHKIRTLGQNQYMLVL